MAGKKKIYQALLEGASKGLSDAELYAFVKEETPKATSKKIVRASLLALTDPDVRDANILHVIYALAIKHRLDPVTDDDGEDEAKPKKDKKNKRDTDVAVPGT
jgi:hypothetical protein